MTAVTLGVTDLHLLARLLSLGLFGLPTIFYTLALHRAKDDAVLLAIVIAAIAIVFMTTSFFIVGEYNTLYAVTILIAVRLATADRLTWPDAIALVLLSLLAIRTYETMIYLGPLLCLHHAVEGVASRRRGPSLPTLLYLVSAVFMIFGMMVAINSVMHPHSPEHLVETWVMAVDFWQNLQFDLVLGGGAGRGRLGAAQARRSAAPPPVYLRRRVPGAARAVAAAGAERRAGPAARQVAVRRAHGERADHRDMILLIVTWRSKLAVPPARRWWRSGRRRRRGRFLGFAC